MNERFETGGAARLARAEAILAQLGFDGVSVDAAGQEREIAVVTAAASRVEDLLDARRAEVVAKLKALGFRYVAVDLQPRR